MRLKSLILTTSVLMPLMLGACDRYMDTPFDSTPSRGIQTASYQAADQLAGQSLNVVTRDTPIAVGTLSDINNIESSSALGRIIAEQVGARFVQLGYNVSEVKLRGDINVQQLPDGGVKAGEYVLSRDATQLAGKTNVKAVISGTYAVAGDNILVNLRLIDVNTARVLAAHDYAMPVNADTRRLTESEAGGGAIFSKGWAK